MAEMNIFLFFKWIGFPIVGYSLYINFGTWKSDVLFILSGLFIVARLYFFIRKEMQSQRDRELSLKEKEHDIKIKIEED